MRCGFYCNISEAGYAGVNPSLWRYSLIIMRAALYQTDKFPIQYGLAKIRNYKIGTRAESYYKHKFAHKCKQRQHARVKTIREIFLRGTKETRQIQESFEYVGFKKSTASIVLKALILFLAVDGLLDLCQYINTIRHIQIQMRVTDEMPETKFIHLVRNTNSKIYS